MSGELRVTEIEAVHNDAGIIGYPIDPDTPAYHWSPTTRRESIKATGLRIRQPSAHAPIRYPMVCLTLDPMTAWLMSGGTFIVDGGGSWDLWAVYAGDLGGFEVIPNDDRTIRELRVYRSIPARHVQYVATRLGGEKP